MPTPVVGFAAFSGTGKTTLLCRLIPALKARGLRLGLVKHSHHPFEIDRPGKDSYRLRRAGAHQVLVASRRRQALIRQHPPDARLTLDDLLQRLDTHGGLDLILVEGYKHCPIPKLELHRPSLGFPLLAGTDPDIIAVASDERLVLPESMPQLNLNDTGAIVDFFHAHFCPLGHAPASPVTVQSPLSR